MTEMGEQSSPSRTSAPWMTMPSRPRRRLPPAELAYRRGRNQLNTTSARSARVTHRLGALTALDRARGAAAGRGGRSSSGHRHRLGGGGGGRGRTPRGGDRKERECEERIEERNRDAAEHDVKDVEGR